MKGFVKGVIFHAHVEYYARQIDGLTGGVRNVDHDTMEAIAEGERDKVELFIEKMKQDPRMSLVDESRVEWEDVTGEFVGFGVRRSG